MARYKGQQHPRQVERALPHIVEMAVPPGGLGRRLDAMHEWHLARGLKSRRGRGRRAADGQIFIRWCFADAAASNDFAAHFTDATRPS